MKSSGNRTGQSSSLHGIGKHSWFQWFGQGGIFQFSGHCRPWGRRRVLVLLHTPPSDLAASENPSFSTRRRPLDHRNQLEVVWGPSRYSMRDLPVKKEPFFFNKRLDRLHRHQFLLPHHQTFSTNLRAEMTSNASSHFIYTGSAKIH